MAARDNSTFSAWVIQEFGVSPDSGGQSSGGNPSSGDSSGGDLSAGSTEADLTPAARVDKVLESFYTWRSDQYKTWQGLSAKVEESKATLIPMMQSNRSRSKL
jgi:hypothetical protein